MSDRTTDEWDALLKGRSEGTWYATDEGDNGSDLIIDETGRSLLTVDELAEGWVGFATVPDGKLAAAAPEAVAEVVRLRSEIEGTISLARAMRGNAQAKAGLIEMLTDILEGDH